MVKGLYTAYTGMINEQNRMDIETHNLANANSTGFKEERSVSQSFRDLLGLKIKDYSDAPWTSRRLGLMNPGVKLAGSYTNFEQRKDKPSLWLSKRIKFCLQVSF